MGETIVIPKNSMYDFSLATRYLFQRSFSPATLEKLYNEIVEVQLRPLNIDPGNRPCTGNSEPRFNDLEKF